MRTARQLHELGCHRRQRDLLPALAFVLASLVFAADGVDAATDAVAYPASVIKVTVPYPPGALTDLLARSLADRLKPALAQPIIVENKPGAGTLVGAEYVAHQPPDGYNLLMATSTTLGIS